MPNSLAQITALLASFNPSARERAGLAAACAALAFLLMAGCWDWVGRSTAQVEAARSKLAEVSSQSVLERSPEFRGLVAADARRAEQWVFWDGTAALAQAHAMETLRAMVDEAGLADISISPRDAPRRMQLPQKRRRDFQDVAFSLSGEMDARQFESLLDALTRSTVSFAVTGCSMKRLDDGRFTVTLTVRALAVIGGTR